MLGIVTRSTIRCKTMTNLVSPFTVANSAIHVTIAGFNNEPLKVRGKNNLLRAFKPRSYRHIVINSAGTLTSFAPNACYSMTDSDVYLNSGWYSPKGQEQEFPGSSSTLTPIYQYGTYTYSLDTSISHRKGSQESSIFFSYSVFNFMIFLAG